jgi:uncharacterized membrane protein YccC
MSGEAPVTESLGAFVRRELAPDPDRVRAFGRTLVALLLATVALFVFTPPNGYWTVTFVVLVSSPAVGKSESDALRRVLAALFGGAAAAMLVITTYDLQWVYVPLQAIGVGVALFLARGTPLGAAAVTGGTTFAVITGASRAVGAAGFIDLAWDRLAQSFLGCGLGALAQLTLWQEDPLAELRRSLRAELSRVEALLGGGRPASLHAGRVVRHFELLANAEMRHPALVQRRAEITLLILDTARLVDQSLIRARLREGPADDAATLLDEVRVQLRRCGETRAFEPPPPPPPPLRPPAWPGLFSDGLRTARRAGVKTALSALVSLLVLDAMQLPAAGALLACLALGLQMSSGSDFTKTFVLLAALAVAMGVILLVSVLAAPNVDDLGSYIVVVALALAPATWAVTAGPRVRNAGTLATVFTSVGVIGSYRPLGELLPSAVFLLSLCIGCLVVTAIDRGVWPISRERVMTRQLLVVIRSAAELMGDLDPRLVLAPSSEPCWLMHRSLRAVVDLRGEQAPAPGTTPFAHEAETTRLAAETQRLVLARVEQARQELSGAATLDETADQRRTWATTLRTRADSIEHNGDVFGQP